MALWGTPALLIGLAAGAVSLHAQSPGFFPLSEVKPGLRGTGKTVFAGDRVEEFQVEVLGVLENTGPRQSLVLARLSGGPLAHTGVMQGMSGSPVYINGRLLGALAVSFQFSKEPVAGIRPIEEMLRRPPDRPASRPQALLGAPGDLLATFLPRSDAAAPQEGRLTDIATPMHFSGFTSRTVRAFAPQLRTLGLEPSQGSLGGGNTGSRWGDPSRLQPGSMISVQLISGDLNLGADGTITLIDGKRVYAFGHRFLSIGSTDMPFARAEVLTLLPNLSASFKISAARELMGAITADHSAAVAGELGRPARLLPVLLSVKAPARGGEERRYALQLVRDRFLTPFLLQLAVFSAIDATERGLGSATVSLNGRIHFEGAVPPVRLDNLYSADINVPMVASFSAAAQLAYALQSGFAALQPARVELDIDVVEEKRQVQVDRLWASPATVRPGESLDIHMAFLAPDGVEIRKAFRYGVPVGAPPGPLQFTLTDAVQANLTDFVGILGQPLRSADQVVAVLNELRPNNRAYLRVTRDDPGFPISGRHLPDPPPSVALILRRAQAASPGSLGAQTRLLERDFDFSGSVVAGSRTIRVEVKQ